MQCDRKQCDTLGRLSARLSAAFLVLALVACEEGNLPNSPPVLTDADKLPLLTWQEASTPIATYVIRNTGGALSTCHTLIARDLPSGLSVNVSHDRRHCEITGMPRSLPQELVDEGLPEIYTIYAANRFGIDSTQVRITEPPAPPTPPTTP